MTFATSTNIASHLPAMAARQPDAMAVAMPRGRRRRAGAQEQYDTWSYAQLNRRSDAIAHGLDRIGVGRGVRTVLLTEPSPAFFALVFALFKVGAVMVCVDPGIGIPYLKRCLAEAEPAAFIGNAKAHLARRLFGWARRTVKTNIIVGRRTPGLGCRHDLATVTAAGGGDDARPYDMTTQGDDIAAVLFTSGSTGAPKGVVYTHANFDAQVRALRDTFDIRPGEIDLSTFPLFALYAPAMGMSAVIPRMDFTRPGSVEPLDVIDPVRRFGVTNLFGSPALLRRVGDYGVRHEVKLPTLRRVLSAGAPVPATVIGQVASMLNNDAQVFTPYGATESLPVACIGSRDILGETAAMTDAGRGVCIGQPVDGIEARVIRITDDAIAQWSDELLVGDGEIGEIVVRGPQVTRTYFNRDDANRLAKIACDDGAFWHRMGDLGYADARGRLWFCGRKSHRVRVGAGDPEHRNVPALEDDAVVELYTIPCEAVFNTHAKVFRTALVGVPDGAASRPVLCVQTQSGVPAAEHDAIRRELLELAQRHEHTRAIGDVLFHPSFPVDIRHNAKIGREKLAIWAAKQLKGRP